MNTNKAVPEQLHQPPLLDRIKAWLWHFQVGGVRFMRMIRAVPSLQIAPIVLWALIGWRPWRFANKALDDHSKTHFRFNPYWTTYITVLLAVIVPFLVKSIVSMASTLSSEDDKGKKRGPQFPIALRYMTMQFLSDPVGTFIIALTPFVAGINPFFWQYKQPWYWKPAKWPWSHIVLTMTFMAVVYGTSRFVLMIMDKWASKFHKKPHWLVIWNKLIMITLALPDRYHSADTSPTVTGDHLGKAQKLPRVGSRHIGVCPVTSPFGSLSGWPTVVLFTQPPFAKDWDDYTNTIPRLHHLLKKLAPWQIELYYSNAQARTGHLIIHFAPPVVADGMTLIPTDLVGPEDPAHDVRGLSVEARIARRAPWLNTAPDPDSLVAQQGGVVHPGSRPEAAYDNRLRPTTLDQHAWVDNAQDQLRREVDNRKERDDS